MNEAIFPLLGTAMVVLLVLPACALLIKGCLVLAERTASSPRQDHLTLRYLLLIGSSLVPLCWFISAGLHQAESGRSALACILDHDAAATCLESGYFALALGLVVFASSLRALRCPTFRVAALDAHQGLRQRIVCLMVESPGLETLEHRVDLCEDLDFALGTRGLLQPRVIVGTHFAQLLSDEMLKSALAHELAHARALDPLRYWLLHVALAINPLGRRLLQPHAARWLAAREAHCDREAVLQGAAPLSLADAIVAAARPGAHVSPALGTGDTRSLKYRVELLLALAERSPTPCGARIPGTFPVALTLLLLALVLPHQTTTGPLDALHESAERGLRYLSP